MQLHSNKKCRQLAIWIVINHKRKWIFFQIKNDNKKKLKVIQIKKNAYVKTDVPTLKKIEDHMPFNK